MDSFNKIGISYIGDYIEQGSNIDKCEKSEKLSAKYTELFIRKDGKESNTSDLLKIYHGELLFHLPTIRQDLSNLKQITTYVQDLVKCGIKYAIIDASLLPLDLYDWSTAEELSDFIKTISSGFAQLISNGITLYIENTSDENNVSYFGKRVENISDIIMYTKNILFKNYDYPKEKIDSSIGVSFNITKLYGEINEYSKWFNVLGDSIKVIKVMDVDNAVSIFDGILTKSADENINPIILLQSNNEIEEVKKKYRKFEYLIDRKNNGEVFSLDNYTEISAKDDNDEYDFSTTNQSGYSSIVIISMIIITILIAIIMIYLKFKN